MIKAKPLIYDIDPYVGGESKSKDGQRIIKLSSNEGALGPSPKAITALQDMADDMHRYPDGGAVELRHALGKSNNINPDNIVCGAGSDEIISLLCNAYIGDGDEVLYSQHGFLMYPISTKAAGGTPVTAPEKNLTTDVDALLNAVTDRTKLLFIANPNNPTGSYIKRDEIKRLRDHLREDILLILDAAYAEYVENPEYTAGHDLVEQYDNIIVTRTFSKIYAMGGMRLGWSHASDHVTDILNRVRGPFNVSSAAQIAGVAALNDHDFLQRSLETNKEVRTWTVNQLESLGITTYPSVTNFILADFETAEKADKARLHWKEQGVLVRQMGAYSLPSCLRITIGTKEEMALAIEHLKGYLT